MSSIIKIQLQSQFQDFSYQILCVFSQIIDIKHIKCNFHSGAWVIPQGWDLGVLWEGQKLKNGDLLWCPINCKQHLIWMCNVCLRSTKRMFGSHWNIICSRHNKTTISGRKKWQDKG